MPYRQYKQAGLQSQMRIKNKKKQSMNPSVTDEGILKEFRVAPSEIKSLVIGLSLSLS